MSKIISKAIVVLILFFWYGFVRGQAEINSDNRFNRANVENNSEATNPEPHFNPGNPPGEDELPIDDYLPLLLITAVGIIVHAGWRKRKQTA